MEDSKQVEAVAKAIYDSMVSQARAAVDAVPFPASDLPEIFSRLARESETGQVLIFGSYIEDRVTGLLKLKMQHIRSADDEDRIFGGNGPLNSFGNRINLAFQLGWLSVGTKKRLDAFRKIRNEFAHSAFKVSFSDAAVSSHFDTIAYDIKAFLNRMKSVLESDKASGFIEEESINRQQRDLCSLAFLAKETFLDLLVLPPR